VSGFRLQRCLDCGHVRHPPRFACPECLSERTEEVPISGAAVVHAFVWYLRPLREGSPPTPYNVTVAELAEGPRLVTTTVGVDIGELAVGDALEAITDDDGDRTQLTFRRIG
jgi:uncharacterized protein